jgi:hypothetical protein
MGDQTATRRFAGACTKVKHSNNLHVGARRDDLVL